MWRELTGKWYLKRSLFGYKVMVEIFWQRECEYTFDKSPVIKTYVKAKPEDLVKLGIVCG